MPTTKSRINISLPADVKRALARIAKRDQMPTATKAGQLLEVALEMEEDQAWDRIAAARDRKNAKFVSHKDAFGV